MKYSRRGFPFAAGAGATALAAPGIAGMIAGRKGVETGGMRAESLWTLQAPPISPAPRLEDERKVDLAVVGGGYTGLSCAYYAKKLRPEWSVVLLESHRLGSGASSRNSGAVYAKYHGVDADEMPRRGFERLARFVAEEEIDCDFKPASVVELYASKRRAGQARASIEPGSTWIPPEQVNERMRTSYYSGAVEYSDYFSVDPARLVVGHVQAARRVGVDLYEHSPVLEVKKGKPAELVTPAARVLADRVFIATNAYTPRLGLLKFVMVPVHQYSLATRKLTDEEIRGFGLDHWTTRFERRILPVTAIVTPSGHFFIRIVIGYASFNSCEWRDIDGARSVAKRILEQRYPWIADIELTHGWHGVTGHTLKQREIACPVMGDNIHVSVAYNGLGVMPGHNNGYLSACRITGHHDDDVRYLAGAGGHYPIPGEFFRSMLFKPFMKLMTPG